MITRIKEGVQQQSPKHSTNTTHISATSQREDYFACPVNDAISHTINDLQSGSEASSDVDGEVEEYSDFDYISQTQAEVERWAGQWGGYMNWPHALEVGYGAAKQIGELEVNKWVHDVLAHADRGRLILQTLEGMKGWLPKEMWKIREIWRRVLELVEVLHRGVACIEIRVDIVRFGSSSFNLLSNTPTIL
jgi:hypothetical protein